MVGVGTPFWIPLVPFAIIPLAIARIPLFLLPLATYLADKLNKPAIAQYWRYIKDYPHDYVSYEVYTWVEANKKELRFESIWAYYVKTYHSEEAKCLRIKQDLDSIIEE